MPGLRGGKQTSSLNSCPRRPSRGGNDLIKHTLKPWSVNWDVWFARSLCAPLAPNLTSDDFLLHKKKVVILDSIGKFIVVKKLYMDLGLGINDQ